MKIFEEYNENGINLKNRIVIAPMCMNSTMGDGMATDFHLVHYGSMAVGGAGLITLESTAIDEDGRIYKGDIGLWNDDQIEPIRRIVDFAHGYGAKISIQINHAGRKCGTSNNLIAPSPIQFSNRFPMPREMLLADIKKVVDQFKETAKRVVKTGADILEIHGAHGYLINQFLSPLSNQRKDNYGGSLENRTRILQEIITAIKSEMPENMPLILRVSAMDFKDGGIDVNDMVEIINLVKKNIDFVHVSTGGVVNDAIIKVFPMYQVEYAKIIKEKCNVKTIAVGLIDSKEQAEKIVNTNKADLVALGRAILRDPQWVLNQSRDLELIPEQLKRAY